jgi:hypothetical protein
MNYLILSYSVGLTSAFLQFCIFIGLIVDHLYIVVLTYSLHQVTLLSLKRIKKNENEFENNDIIRISENFDINILKPVNQFLNDSINWNRNSSEFIIVLLIPFIYFLFMFIDIYNDIKWWILVPWQIVIILIIYSYNFLIDKNIRIESINNIELINPIYS